MILMQFLSNAQKRFFVDIDELFLRFLWKGLGPRIKQFSKTRIQGEETFYLILMFIM